MVYKKYIKILLSILLILLLVIIIDTIQAKLFNNNPILKVVEDYNGGYIYQKHTGVLVYTWNLTDGTKETYFRWKNYIPKPNLEK